jgi:hypothetical protein
MVLNMVENKKAVERNDEVIGISQLADGDILSVNGIGKTTREFTKDKTKNEIEVIILRLKKPIHGAKNIAVNQYTTMFNQITDYVLANFAGEFPVKILDVDFTVRKTKGDVFSYYTIEELSKVFDVNKAFE